MFRLDIKRVLLTGGAGYLGFAFSENLLNQGAELWVFGHREEPESVELLKARFDSRLHYIACDITDEHNVQNVINQISTPLHVLINNAHSGGAGNISLSRAQDFRNAFKFGLVAINALVKSCLRKMRKSRELGQGATIINVASIYGIVSPRPLFYDPPASQNTPYYGAVKAALIQRTKYLAAEFGKIGICSNSLCLGPFPDKTKGVLKEFEQFLAARTMLNPIDETSKVAGPLVFLASDASSFLTDANIVVDGGWTAW